MEANLGLSEFGEDSIFDGPERLFGLIQLRQPASRQLVLPTRLDVLPKPVLTRDQAFDLFGLLSDLGLDHVALPCQVEAAMDRRLVRERTVSFHDATDQPADLEFTRFHTRLNQMVRDQIDPALLDFEAQLSTRRDRDRVPDALAQRAVSLQDKAIKGRLDLIRVVL